MFELVPGSYVVRVFFVECGQVTVGRPEGFLNKAFIVAPGGAALVSRRHDLYAARVGIQVMFVAVRFAPVFHDPAAVIPNLKQKT